MKSQITHAALNFGSEKNLPSGWVSRSLHLYFPVSSPPASLWMDIENNCRDVRKGYGRTMKEEYNLTNHSQHCKHRTAVQSTSGQERVQLPLFWIKENRKSWLCMQLALLEVLTLQRHCTCPGRQWATPTHSSYKCGRCLPKTWVE